MKKTDKFILHQRRLATLSISASAFRNQGRRGLIGNSQNFLATKLNLYDFGRSLKNRTFKTFLNQQTEDMIFDLRKFKIKWGTARKGLNLFFRDVFYSRYFYKQLKLQDGLASQLELPLDSFTMKNIIKDSTSLKLNSGFNVLKEKSIVSLNKSDSEVFQSLAEKVAEKMYPNFYKVDLDLIYWRKK